MQAGKSQKIDNSRLPQVERFRQWLGEGIRKTGVSASAISKSAGLSQNTVSRFLGSESDICLGSAFALEREIFSRAAEGGIEISPLTPGEVSQ